MFIEELKATRFHNDESYNPLKYKGNAKTPRKKADKNNDSAQVALVTLNYSNNIDILRFINK